MTTMYNAGQCPGCGRVWLTPMTRNFDHRRDAATLKTQFRGFPYCNACWDGDWETPLFQEARAHLKDWWKNEAPKFKVKPGNIKVMWRYHFDKATRLIWP